MIDFGFLFWQSVHFYHIDPDRLLAMPIRWFWSMVRNLDRIRASQEIRSLNVLLVAAAASQGDEKALAELRASLIEQMGTIMRFKEKTSSKAEIMSLVEGL